MAEEPDALTVGAAGLISRDPLILVVPSDSGERILGLIPLLAQKIPQTPATFLSPLFWHCDEATARNKADAVRNFTGQYPNHQVIFLGNTLEEVALLRVAGAEAFFANHNIFADENAFYPFADSGIEFDAVYNARPWPEKRHNLAAEIGRVIYIGYPGDLAVAARSRAITAILQQRAPRHLFANVIVDGLPRPIARPEVNAVLARAAVGLCLSEVEGAMYASIEYLLAGLPVVSTPSRGGRDVFFDPDYCVIAEANASAVREAVAALRGRNIPRAYVRARTLAKLEVERQRFVAFLEQIRMRSGVARAYGTQWPFSGPPFAKWQSFEIHAREMFG